MKKRLVLAAVAFALSVPAAAQMGFSESYSFLKAVRDRDGGKIQELTGTPNAAVINARDPSTGEGALHLLVRLRDRNILGFLLSRGARADLTDNEGATALVRAAQIGWVDGAEVLLAGGANPNLANARGETPLIIAVQRRDLPMVRLLRSQGADPNLTDNVAGYSALDYARQDRRAAAILRILE